MSGPATAPRQRYFDPVHLGWAIGTLGVSLQLNTFNVMTLFFLVTVLHIEPWIAGAAITASKLYDAVTDPLMGSLSDRTRSRWGRRRPWLLVGGLGCGLAFAALYSIPPLPAQTLLISLVTAALLLLSTFYTVFNVPYLAMPAEMTDDYHERSVMMSYRVFLISIGTFVGVSAAPAIVAWFQESLELPAHAAYRYMGWLIGLVMSAAMLASFFGTRHARSTVATPVAIGGRERLRLLLSNRPFLLFMGIKLAGLFALASVLASQLFFVVYLMQRSTAIVGLYGALQLAGQVVAIPAWLWLARRAGKARVLWISSLLMLVISATWLLSGPAEPLWIYAVRGLALGLAGSGTILGTQAILPDIMEYDYRRTGLRREGIYAGVASFIEKISGALAGITIGGFLSLMQFDRNLGPGEQPESALLAIMACMALVPMASYALKLLLLYFFRLDERTLKNTRRVTGD